MAEGVKPRIRRKRVHVTDAGSWADALVETVEGMKHGDYRPLHSVECPAQRGAVCDCEMRMLGPAIKDDWQ